MVKKSSITVFYWKQYNEDQPFLIFKKIWLKIRYIVQLVSTTMYVCMLVQLDKYVIIKKKQNLCFF